MQAENVVLVVPKPYNIDISKGSQRQNMVVIPVCSVRKGNRGQIRWI